MNTEDAACGRTYGHPCAGPSLPIDSLVRAGRKQAEAMQEASSLHQSIRASTTPTSQTHRAPTCASASLLKCESPVCVECVALPCRLASASARRLRVVEKGREGGEAMHGSDSGRSSGGCGAVMQVPCHPFRNDERERCWTRCKCRCLASCRVYAWVPCWPPAILPIATSAGGIGPGGNPGAGLHVGLGAGPRTL